MKKLLIKNSKIKKYAKKFNMIKEYTMCCIIAIKPGFSYLLLSNPESIFEVILLDHHPFPIVTDYSIPSIFNHFSNVRVFKTHAIDEYIWTLDESVL